MSPRDSLRFFIALATVVSLVAGPPARAEQATKEDATVEELKRRVQELEHIVSEQQDALRKLLAQSEQKPLPPPSPPEAAAVSPPSPPPPSPPPAAAPSYTSNYFNPSVSAIGNFLAVGGSNPVENLPSAELRESEVALQAIVDPYARADFFISFGEEGVGVEEGFASFTSLPGKFLVKVGRQRISFGKINTLHLHVLPWADEPLNVVNLLGGEEGWVGTGVSVARLIPLPGDTFSELTLQAMRPERLFVVESRGDLAYNGHYRLFRDLSESVNLDLGLSYGLGPNGTSPDAKTRLEGIDTTLRWKPLRTATYRSATFRGEYFRSQREDPAGDQKAKGWFASEDYQLAKRWFVGGRVEAANRAADASMTDRGGALILTFWPSEFSQLRSELRRRKYADGTSADEVLLQVQFAIGAHGAHPF